MPSAAVHDTVMAAAGDSWRLLTVPTQGVDCPQNFVARVGLGLAGFEQNGGAGLIDPVRKQVRRADQNRPALYRRGVTPVGECRARRRDRLINLVGRGQGNHPDALPVSRINVLARTG